MTIVCTNNNARPSGQNVDPDQNIIQTENVQELKLSGKDIKTIPEYVRKNSCLKILDLSHNLLGQGSEDFSLLKNLTRLNLSSNELKKVSNNLCACSSLEVLCLSGNELEELPEELLNLQRLKRLHCDFNHLKKLPPDLSSLTSLTTVTLSNNKLEDVPATIWTLQSLQALNLQRNFISHIGPLPDGAANHLRELKIGRNRLSGNLDLNPLVNLTFLDAAYNDLEELEVSNLHLLEVVIISHNSLKSLNIDGAKLKLLKADANDLEKVVIKQPILYLETLDISHNNLTALPNWIGDAKMLTTICANHNRITSLPTELFSCNALRSLHLNHNLLDKIPHLTSPCLVKYLFLQYNKIEKLPENFFIIFPCLDTLNLSYNSLQMLPEAECATNIKTAILAGNHLRDLQQLVKLFKRSLVESLHLSCNGVKEVPSDFFPNLPTLKNLSLSGNEIEEIFSQINLASNLKKLYLHSNKLKSLPLMNGSSNLQILDLACNDLHEVELASLVPKQMTYLDLSANCNLVIDPKDFQHLCSQRSVAVVDVNCAGRQAPLNENSKLTENESISAWHLGFTESPDGHTRLYIELQKDSATGREEALIALMEVDDYEQVTQLRQSLPELLKIERECKETYPHYLKNVLLSSVRFLRKRGYTKDLGITLCHLSSMCESPVTLRLATIGRPSSCVLGRAGNVIVLAQRSEVSNVGVDEWKAAMEETEICCNNYFNTMSQKCHPKGLWDSIPDPEVRELILSPQDKFLVFGDSAFSRTVPADEVCRQVQTTKSPVSAAKALAEIYSALSTGNRECIAVIMLKSNTLPNEEEVEKYRCWEFMLEQNHKLLFTKELETIHKTILRNGSQRNGNTELSSWYTAALSKYKCPLPSHRGRYYCYGNKTD